MATRTEILMPSRLQQAIEKFDQLNAEDPNQELDNGVLRPRELVQAERLYAWVLKLEPDASEALKLAARCQHIRRWEIPRSSFPEGRIGYLKWRTELGRFHADTAERVLSEVGYDADTLLAVRRINQKRGLATDPDTQTIEDALCLTFLEFEFDAFSRKHPDEKVIDIVQKTWRKMSERGHQTALSLPLSERAKALVLRALRPEAAPS
jgi:hypothetical protein